MQEDRQREIAAENYSLMNRLAGIMKEERGDPVQKFAHLSVQYRESLRRKKLLKLEVSGCMVPDALRILNLTIRSCRELGPRIVSSDSRSGPGSTTKRIQLERAASIVAGITCARKNSRIAVSPRQGAKHTEVMPSCLSLLSSGLYSHNVF